MRPRGSDRKTNRATLLNGGAMMSEMTLDSKSPNVHPLDGPALQRAHKIVLINKAGLQSRPSAMTRNVGKPQTCVSLARVRDFPEPDLAPHA